MSRGKGETHVCGYICIYIYIERERERDRETERQRDRDRETEREYRESIERGYSPMKDFSILVLES